MPLLRKSSVFLLLCRRPLISFMMFNTSFMLNMPCHDIDMLSMISGNGTMGSYFNMAAGPGNGPDRVWVNMCCQHQKIQLCSFVPGRSSSQGGD